MHEKDNYLKNAELSTEQNCNMIDGIPNNTPLLRLLLNRTENHWIK